MTSGSEHIAFLQHLTGFHAGSHYALKYETHAVGTDPMSAIHFPLGSEPTLAGHHATLVRDGDTYFVQAEPGCQISVNGEETAARLLKSGDIVQIGVEGPTMRFVAGDRAPIRKRRLGKSWRWLPIGLTAVALFLAVQNWQIRRELSGQEMRVDDIAALLDEAQRESLSPDDLRDVRSALSDAVDRVGVLEDRSTAGQRFIAEYGRSVMFIQGGYGFLESEGGRPVRYVVGADGQPLTDFQGNAMLTFDGDGPFYESLFTGTGFVATDDGRVITNRHVAEPWFYDTSMQSLVDQGFVPVMRRLIGYLPRIADPFDLSLVVSSTTADIAILHCSEVTTGVAALELSEGQPTPGETVFVMGYPTGMRALLARTSAAFVDTLLSGPNRSDFWVIASELSSAGLVAPLATQGIVGQVTSTTIVYDAETASGGSGGPVVDANGRVVAVNTAILSEFGGSNLGVPIAEARLLLDLAGEN